MSTLLHRITVRIAPLLIAALVAVAVPSTTAQAAGDDVTFVGHGHGPGRGMGQYGAYGYAVDHGWGAARILNHFYGGTTLSGDAGNPVITVELNRVTGGDTIVTGPGLAISGIPVPGAAVLVRRSGNGTFVAQVGPSCAGPWSPWRGFGSGLMVHTSGDQANLANLATLCEPTKDTGYRGGLEVIDAGGKQVTLSVLGVDDYLRGVLPREMPASWGSAGGGAGMEALRAQAVAARSYALGSAARASGATTCDSESCQVYGGAFERPLNTGVYKVLEASNSTLAVQQTSGHVMRAVNGTIARTEFSSSTGGWTAGGTFPAVEDAGDATSNNANHTWTKSLSWAEVGAALGTGQVRSISVTQRNGLGAHGGRTLAVNVTGTSGQTTTFTGAAVRLKLGLKSDWFAVASMTLAEAQSIVKAMYADLLLRDVDANGLETWGKMLVAGAGQPALVASLTSSQEYVQLRIRQAYREVLGREAEPSGVVSWSQEINAGRMTVDGVKRRFYDSDEYYARSGGSPAGYVDLLYRTAFERAATADESANWAGQIGVIGRSKVVDGIWYSLEAALYRAGGYYQVFLKRAPDRAGQENWAWTLVNSGEGAVRIGIAGSQEYRQLASTRFP